VGVPWFCVLFPSCNGNGPCVQKEKKKECGSVIENVDAPGHGKFCPTQINIIKHAIVTMFLDIENL